MSRRAKIVCTLGPATSSAEQVTAIAEDAPVDGQLLILRVDVAFIPLL